MAEIITITANWNTGSLSNRFISRQYDNNRYRIQFMGYPEDVSEDLIFYLLVWMRTDEAPQGTMLAPIQMDSDQWLISNYFTQKEQQIKFQLCIQNESGTFEAHSPIFNGSIQDSLDHDGEDIDIDTSSLFDYYREYVNNLIIQSGAVVIDADLDEDSENPVQNKIVAGAITALNGRLTKYTEKVIGIKDYLAGVTWVSGARINADGTIVTGAGYEYSAEIPLTTGTYKLIYRAGATALRVHGYKNGAWVKQIFFTTNTTEKSFSVDNAEVDAIRVSHNISNSDVYALVSGPAPLVNEFSKYVPTSRAINGKTLTEDVTLTMNDITGLPGAIANAEAKTTALGEYTAMYNQYANGQKDYLYGVSKTSGAYINDAGEVVTGSGSFYTDLISVDKNYYWLLYSSRMGTVWRIHGYKDGAWVKMLTKVNAAATYEKKFFEFDLAEVDAIRISGNVATFTPHMLVNYTPIETSASRYDHGPYKVFGHMFDGWYQCMATDEEIASYSFGRSKSYADTVALYDTLVDGEYVQKRFMYHLDQLDMDIYEYVFLPKIYLRSPTTAEGEGNFRRTPKILLDASMHGFEKGGTFANFVFLYDLVHRWRQNPSLTYLHNYVELHVNPIVNPYGFENNTYYNENSVNINRNFDCSTWEYHEPGAQGSGDEPGTEDETKMVMHWASVNADALAYIDHHTNGEYFATDPRGLNLCYFPRAEFTDEYNSRWYNVIAKHIEMQTMMYPAEFPDVDFGLENTDTQDSYLGRYQETTHHGTVDVWSLEHATMPIMTLECINGWKISTSVPNENAQIRLWSATAMRIGAENVGNFICQLLQEFCR